MNEGITLPFKVLPVINEVGRTKLEANVTIKSTFSNKLQVRETGGEAAWAPLCVCGGGSVRFS